MAKWLRPHQREGVQFMYECVMGLKGFPGAGCILADDMVSVKQEAPNRSDAVLLVIIMKSCTNRLIVVCCIGVLTGAWEGACVRFIFVG